MSVRNRTIRCKSFLLHGSTAADDAIGSSLEIGIDVIDIGGDIGIVGETSHHRLTQRFSKAHDAAEIVYVRKPFDQRRSESRPKSIGAMTVVA